MARFVVDPRTLVALLDSDRSVHPLHSLVAPNALRSQALELLLTDVRAERRSESEALALHEAMTRLKVRLLGDRVSRRTAWRIAQEQGWSDLRDAEYIAVAKLQADALVTVDGRLAAHAAGLVTVAGFETLFAAD